jgi:hypothetical protein
MLPLDADTRHNTEPLLMKLPRFFLLAALAASPPTFALPTFVVRFAPDAENFAMDTHDQRDHALLQGQPSFADLAGMPPGLLVAAERDPDVGDPPSPVPEPHTWAMMFGGLAALVYVARRRRH